MTLEQLDASLTQPVPPEGLSSLLRALWYERRGDWDQAHKIAQEIHDADGAWIHAYLHRREGDLANAAYWYRVAGRPVESGDMDAEWRAIVTELLARG